jgi:outer membrane PBP1 activator LpoA protein
MKKLTVILAILLVSACGNQPIRPDNREYIGLDQATSYYQAKDYQNAALAYQELFNQYSKPEFAIIAADSYLQIQQFLKAEQLINSIQLSDQPLHLLVLTELALFNQQDNAALNYFNQIRLKQDTEYYNKYLLVKSKLYRQYHDYLQAALALIELSQLDELSNYNDSIINFLSMTSESSLSKELFNPELNQFALGWLEAAYVGFSKNPNAVNQWKNNWPNHPGIEFFLSSIRYNKIAVLLPFSGRYQNISNSIQQGMIAAMYPNAHSEQELIFFDTGSDGENFSNAWYGALDSAAELIIGPLEKKSIEQLTQLNSSTIPVILLNEIESETNPLGFYQFPLSPEDEAKNIATRLIAENKKRVLLLAPESEMGRREAIAFEKEFNFDDGLIVNYAFYPPTAHDYSNEMKSTLGLIDSKQRINRLERILGTELESEPQIRPDIDAIVIFASAKQARLIKPQLKFFKAEDVPVYTSSQVFTGKVDKVLDKDLNGIKFTQSKFVTTPDLYSDTLEFDVNRLDSSLKFFAFGYDAITLSSKIELMHRHPNQKYEGLSGWLSLDSKGAIHRELGWAQFRRGVPVLLADIVVDSWLEVNPVEEDNSEMQESEYKDLQNETIESDSDTETLTNNL